MSAEETAEQKEKPSPKKEKGASKSTSDKSRGDRSKRKIGQYYIGKVLGTGATSVVRLCVHEKTEKEYALKILKKSSVAIRRLAAELLALQRLDHIHIVNLKDTYETSSRIWIVLELLQGEELFKLVFASDRGMERKLVLQYFRQMALGVQHMHSKGIVHRDLKPSNMMITKDGIKIVDFGLAGIVNNGTLLTTRCGSPHYVSPEVIRGKKYDGMLSDIWSLGIILFVMASGQMPFGGSSVRAVMKSIATDKLVIPDHVDADIADLITRLLKHDPQRRVSISGALEHPVFLTLPPELKEKKPKSKGLAQSEPVLPHVFSQNQKKHGVDNSMQSEGKEQKKTQAVKPPMSGKVPSSMATPSPIAPSLQPARHGGLRSSCRAGAGAGLYPETQTSFSTAYSTATISDYSSCTSSCASNLEAAMQASYAESSVFRGYASATTPYSNPASKQPASIGGITVPAVSQFSSLETSYATDRVEKDTIFGADIGDYSAIGSYTEAPMSHTEKVKPPPTLKEADESDPHIQVAEVRPPPKAGLGKKLSHMMKGLSFSPATRSRKARGSAQKNSELPSTPH